MKHTLLSILLIVVTGLIYGQEQCIFRIQPENTETCLNDTAVFNASVDTLFFESPFYFDWLSKPNGSSDWTIIENNEQFEIITIGLFSTLKVMVGGSATFDGDEFRCRVSGLYNSDIASLEINVPPVISFTSDNYCFQDITHFINTSEDESSIVSWIWEISDSQEYFSKDINHMFAEPGDYAVKLSGIDINGCVGEFDNTVTINQLPEPVISFTKDVFCSYESNVSFYTAGTFMTYDWEITGINETIQSDTTEIVFDCNDNFPTGQYSVRLTVSNLQGCYEEVEKSFLVLNSKAPVDGFVIQKEVDSKLLVLLIEEQDLSLFRWLKIDMATKDTLIDIQTNNPYHLFDDVIDTQNYRYGVEVMPEYSDCSALFFLKP